MIFLKNIFFKIDKQNALTFAQSPIFNMTKSEAYDQFSQWYESCIEHGLDPSAVISEIGGMILITNEDLIQKLEEEGKI